MKCYVVREHDFRLIAKRTLDVSQDGMLVASGACVEPGDSLIVSFRATELGIWFDTGAVVARIVRGKRCGDKERAVGLRFDTLDAVKRMILRADLRRHPPALPNAFRDPRIDYAATVGRLLIND
jgi:hypothetical protein